MIWEGTSHCWEAACDNCGRHTRHFDTKAEMTDRLEAAGWWVERRGDRRIFCDLCADVVFDRIRNLRAAWN